MSWPALSFCERWVDWSYYQNSGFPLYRPFDVDAFCDAHPEVDGAVIRAVWPDGSRDQHYDHYYDGFTAKGKKVAAYLWPNPQKSIAAAVEDWKRGLGERIPKLIGFDYEEASTFSGVSNAALTTLMRATFEAARQNFSSEVINKYSRGSWLDSRIIPGPWIHELPWWLAHWIFPKPDVQKQAESFAEVDAKLPIDNGFTPFRGNIVKLAEHEVIGWQFSSQLKIVPRGICDGSYFLKSFLDPIYGTPIPPPPPPSGDKIPVEIRVPAGKAEVRITEL